VITNPFEGIPSEIVAALNKHLPENNSYHQTHKRRTARTIQLLLEKKPSGSCLELGTSEVIPLLLHELEPKLSVHVTDFDMTKFKDGQMSFKSEDVYIFCPVYRLDLETEPLPTPDETFDVVLCCEVIEHLEVDPMFMLSEINRVLKPDGLLILTTPNITSTRGLYKMLRSLEPYFYMQYRHKPALYRHNYEYSVTTMKQVLKEAGFSGRVWSEDTFEDPLMEDIEKLRKIGYALPYIGDNIFAVVRKIGPVRNRHPQSIYAD
jgi:ubiquinone/menaquinone biosynthesis C-methylase UbiE